MQEMINSERRKYQRLPARLELTCVPFRLGGFSFGISKSMTKNIGAGGILLESRKKYSLSELLKLEINIPGWEKFKPEFYRPDVSTGSKPLVAIGKVVWISEGKLSEVFDMGIQFMGIDEGHQWGLMKFINSKVVHDRHV
jgi:hypothetical protein